jgi:hypothetical protein
MPTVETNHALLNARYHNEVIPLSAKAFANLKVLEAIDGLHEYHVFVHNHGDRRSVIESVRSWLDGDSWGPCHRTEHGLPEPGWRARCLEAHPALAVHLAVNGSAGGRALSAVCALDIGNDIDEVARIAQFRMRADIDLRRLRVVPGRTKGRWEIGVVPLHRSFETEKQPKRTERARRKIMQKGKAA